MHAHVMTAFSEKERTALKLYCRTCDEILECRFVKDLPKQDHTTRSWRNPDGLWDGYAPVYDRDDFRSFMAIFRKLLLNKEPTNIYQILNILSRHTSYSEREQLKKIRKILQKLERHSFKLNLGTDDDKAPYTPRQACDVILNADLFHSDPEKQQALEKLQSFGSIFQGFLLKFVTDFCCQAVQVSGVVKQRKYFD